MFVLLRKLSSVFPSFSDGLPEPMQEVITQWVDSPLIPTLHVVIIFFILIIVFRLFNSSRKPKELEHKSWMIDPEPYRITVEHLTWANKIISWLFLSSSSQMPTAVETWIQDLNMHIAMQHNKFTALIYGLRDGSAIPWLLEIKSIKTHMDDVHAEILLKTTEFGFAVSIQEDTDAKDDAAAANFSAVVTHFQCWFSAVLTRLDGDVGLIVKPIEKRPIFQLVMKPITQNTSSVTLQNRVAQSIKEAVLSTTFYANLNTLSSKLKLPVLTIQPSDEEHSCYGDTDEEENAAKGVKIPSLARVNRSMSVGQDAGKPPVIRRRRLSAEQKLGNANELGNRSMTHFVGSHRPAGFSDKGKHLSSSLGSLSSLTRTPSGRGPAKPIRYKEKSLLVRDIFYEAYKHRVNYPVDCSMELDFPHQTRTLLLTSVSRGNYVTFDLSSRSSKLKVTLRYTSDYTSDELMCKGGVSIESISMDTATRIGIPMRDNVDVGLLKLELLVKENEKKSDSVQSKSRPVHKTSQSTKLQRRGSGRDRLPKKSLKQLPACSSHAKTGEGAQGETKITSVTRMKGSPSRSPYKDQATSTESDDGEKIIYKPGSVVETALKDLSSKQKSPVTKTKICITAVEKNSGNPASVVLESDEQTDTSGMDPPFREPLMEVDSERNYLTPSASFTAPHDSPKTRDVKLRTKERNSGSSKIRRTRSLIFGSGKKKKNKPERNSSALIEDDRLSLQPSSKLEYPGEKNLNKKSSSMNRLFVKMSRKKGSKTLNDGTVSLREEEELSPLQPDVNAQVSPFDGGATKIKRNRSFKDIIKGKKKSQKP